MYYIRTASGKKFDYSLGEDNAVDIHDIASALSKMPRFSGACEPFLSVAQHSIHVAVLAEANGPDPVLAMHGLLHDGHEAFLGDIPTPATDYFFDETGIDFKGVLTPGIDKAIFAMAGLQPLTDEQAQKLHLCDLAALNAEGKRVVRGWQDIPDVPFVGNLSVSPMTHEQARRAFMEKYIKLKTAMQRSR